MFKDWPIYKTGDIVRHSSHFLRCIAWHTGVPKNGIVMSIDNFKDVGCHYKRQACRVSWSDGTTCLILSTNLEKSK